MLNHRAMVVHPLLKGLFALLLFGSVPCTVRYIAFDSIAIGSLRLSMAAASLGLILAARNRLVRLSYSQWKTLVYAGLAFGGHWFFYFLGIKLGSAAIGALGFSTYGIQLALLGKFFKLSQLQKSHYIALTCTMLGSFLIIAGPGPGPTGVLGLLSGIVSGTFYAILPILHQKNSAIPDDIRALGQFSFALLIFLPLMPWASFTAPGFDWLLILYLGLIVTLVGHTLWVQASTALPTTTTAIISYLYLPTAMFLSWLLLGEAITLHMLIGAGCILAGNSIGLLPRRIPR